MYTHIFVPTDGSKLSGHAANVAIGLAKWFGARITAFHMVARYHLNLQEEGFAMPRVAQLMKRFEQAEAARGKKLLARITRAAQKKGVDCNALMVVGDSPYRTIIEQAAKSKCDLIVMASRGRKGLKGLLLGSETVRVLTHSKIPVLVCH